VPNTTHMTPNPVLQSFAVLLVVASYAGLFGALLIDTLNAEQAFEPDDFTSTVTPLLAGALGLVLAAALGVEVKAAAGVEGIEKLKVLLQVQALLLLGAMIYLASAVFGGYVWWQKGGTITPEVVKTVVLAVVGYLVATVAALARPP
jgi:hypothetical protein